MNPSASAHSLSCDEPGTGRAMSRALARPPRARSRSGRGQPPTQPPDARAAARHDQRHHDYRVASPGAIFEPPARQLSVVRAVWGSHLTNGSATRLSHAATRRTSSAWSRTTSGRGARAPLRADQLTAVRRARFVGRQPELDLFRSALLTPEPPFAVLYVHGPSGIGLWTLVGSVQNDSSSVPCSPPTRSGLR